MFLPARPSSETFVMMSLSAARNSSTLTAGYFASKVRESVSATPIVSEVYQTSAPSCCAPVVSTCARSAPAYTAALRAGVPAAAPPGAAPPPQAAASASSPSARPHVPHRKRPPEPTRSSIGCPSRGVTPAPAAGSPPHIGCHSLDTASVGSLARQV